MFNILVSIEYSVVDYKEQPENGRRAAMFS